MEVSALGEEEQQIQEILRVGCPGQMHTPQLACSYSASAYAARATSKTDSSDIDQAFADARLAHGEGVFGLGDVEERGTRCLVSTHLSDEEMGR